MRSRPRTPVEICVWPLDTRLALFSLDNLGPELSRLGQGRTRATQRQTLATFACRGDTTSLADRLDRAWAPLDLRGAALLYAGTTSPLFAKACGDALLVLNVLARARGNVLLPDAPLVLQAGALNRYVMTDDPRLTALVFRKREGDA